MIFSIVKDTMAKWNSDLQGKMKRQDTISMCYGFVDGTVYFHGLLLCSQSSFTFSCKDDMIYCH